MASSNATGRVRREIIACMREVPTGRVTTYDAIGRYLHILPRQVAHVLANLTDDERQIVPWHRAVARGGAIGHGANRDAQFARLIREGLSVAPAGIVQDLPAAHFDGFAGGKVKPLEPSAVSSSEVGAVLPTKGRSRGMKDRP